jgi:hypothetical protein
MYSHQKRQDITLNLVNFAYAYQINNSACTKRGGAPGPRGSHWSFQIRRLVRAFPDSDECGRRASGGLLVGRFWLHARLCRPRQSGPQPQPSRCGLSSRKDAFRSAQHLSEARVCERGNRMGVWNVYRIRFGSLLPSAIIHKPWCSSSYTLT